MGWFSSLGKRISGAVHSIGQKARGVVRTGRKFVHDHAAQIEKISKTVGDVAGVVGNIATAALPFTAGIPGVGEVVGGLAAGGKALQAGARWVQKGAGTARKAEAALGGAITSAEGAYKHGRSTIDDLRRRDLASASDHAIKIHKDLQSTRKQIESTRR